MLGLGLSGYESVHLVDHRRSHQEPRRFLELTVQRKNTPRNSKKPRNKGKAIGNPGDAHSRNQGLTAGLRVAHDGFIDLIGGDFEIFFAEIVRYCRALSRRFEIFRSTMDFSYCIKEF